MSSNRPWDRGISNSKSQVTATLKKIQLIWKLIILNWKVNETIRLSDYVIKWGKQQWNKNFLEEAVSVIYQELITKFRSLTSRVLKV